MKQDDFANSSSPGAIGNAQFLYLRAQALAHPLGPLSPPMTRLSQALLPNLAQIHEDFVAYYGLNPQVVLAEMGQLFQYTVHLSDADVIAAAMQRNIDWGIHLCELIKVLLWSHSGLQYLNTDALDEAAFRTLFEREWDILLRFRGSRYNFRVVPKLSLDAFVRYQELKHGNRVIRQIISSYLAHESKNHPYFVETLAPEFGAVAFGRRLRRLYAPLIALTARHALKTLEAQGKAHQRLLAALREEAGKTFDEAWTQFEFHVSHCKTALPWGWRGILGLAEDAAFRAKFDAYLQGGGAEELELLLPAVEPGKDEVLQERAAAYVQSSMKLTPVLFSMFIRRRLVTWLNQNYPPLKREPRTVSLSADTFEGLREKAPDASVSGMETPAVANRAGELFFTVEQAACWYGASVRQLRYADVQGRLKALRASEVPTAVYQESGQPVRPNVRLYPATSDAAEAARTALVRVAARASDLQGTELTRTAAASYLGVSVDVLRFQERQGAVAPESRGRTVVYTPAILEQAKAALAQARLAQARTTLPTGKRKPGRPKKR